MMRFNAKVALLCLCVAVLLITISLWSICGESSRKIGIYTDNSDKIIDSQGGEEIDCDINGEYTIGCHKEGDEVYIPFSFLQKYFEVYGKLTTYDGLDRFEWSHSYSKIYHPKSKYDPRGVFMYFENYNVEVRDRVKCVSGTEGVPMSTQWECQGYYYPTQIAQFGLSHYSKNLTEPEPRRKTIEDADREFADWIVPDSSSFNRVLDERVGSRVFKFATSEMFSNSIRLKMDHVLDFVVSFSVILQANSSFALVLQNREKKEIYNLHYVASDTLLAAQVSIFKLSIKNLNDLVLIIYKFGMRHCEMEYDI